VTTEDGVATRIRELLSQILDVPAESIGPGFSRETAASWTSLNHLMLVSQIEAEFGLMFSNPEIRELTSFERIFDALIRRQAESG
jgi:acyl carrier protein